MTAPKSRNLHIRTVAQEEWLTPPAIVSALGPFDLDPCAPIKRPWETARSYYTILDDGLRQPWTGRVWCNPPYGAKTGVWLAKCAEHGNALALIFARTETRMFFAGVWEKAEAVLFLRGRLRFLTLTAFQDAALAVLRPSLWLTAGRTHCG